MNTPGPLSIVPPCDYCGGYGTAMIQAVSGVHVRGPCPACNGTCLQTKPKTPPPFRGVEMPEEMVKGLMAAAGFEVLGMIAIQNRYWGQLEGGAHPWWHVKTAWGIIEIGHRKRVISINWADTPIRSVVTEDDVTKDKTYVHAYSMEKALAYLSTLRAAAKATSTIRQPESVEEAEEMAKIAMTYLHEHAQHRLDLITKQVRAVLTAITGQS